MSSARMTDIRAVGAGLLGGVVITAMASQFSEMGTRYLVFGVVGGLVGTLLMSLPNRRRVLLGVTLVSLQLDASIFFDYVGKHRSTGWSGPPGVMLPISFLPAMVLLTYLWVTQGRAGRRIEFGGEAGRAGLAVTGAAIVSIGVSSWPFLSTCYALQMVQLLTVYLAITNAVTDRRDHELALRVLQVVVFTQATVYFVESAVGHTFAVTGDAFEAADGRHGGTVGVSPADFTSFMMPLVLLVAAQVVTVKGRAPRPAVVLTGMGLVAILCTYTRASWAGTAFGVVAIVLLAARRGLLNRRYVMVLGMLAVVGLAIAFPKMALRLANNAADSEERKGLMLVAIEVIKGNPILGVGGGMYALVFRDYVPYALSKNWLFVVHNTYLLQWAEMGLPGILALIALLGIAVRDAWRLAHSDDRQMAVYGIGWFGGLIALLWEMYWDVWRGFTYNAMLWALIGLAAAAGRIERERRCGVEARSGGVAC
ncbi:MAG: O-antigen ligase family protein [Candidatus Binatia bacterium]